MSNHRRRLPHEFPKGRALFLTWHLYGSLPTSRFPPPGEWSSGEAFAWVDRYLDNARAGPLFLRDDRIARLVAESIHYSAEKLRYFELYAYVVMANHVHLLVAPLADPSKFMQSLKGYTARRANRLLSRTGSPFWQRETYDHWVRNETEQVRIHAYIENNPVKAGLVRRPDDYRWSSAHIR